MKITAFAAFYGEYEEPHPIGIYDSLDKAKEAVEKSNPNYDTEVKEYDLVTGCVINEWLFSFSFNHKDKKWTKTV